MTTIPSDVRPEETPRAPRSTWGAVSRVLMIGWAVLLVLGLVGIIMRITDGHLPAGYGSYVPWGLWIAIYFHGVGIAAGAFAVSALGYVLQVPGFRQRSTLRIAAVLVAATIGPALLAVGLDLGHMERAYRIVFSPSFTSMMAFNSWMYIALLAVVGIVWWLTFVDDRGWLKPLLILGLVISVMVPSQSGAFFGVVDAKPYWHSALLPVMLLVSGLTAGAATLLVVRGLLGLRESNDFRGEVLAAITLLRTVVLIGIGVYFVIEFAEFSIALWNTQTTAPEIELVLFGPYWWVFWLVHVVAGGIVPFLLLLSRRPWLWMTAGALVAVTFISTRLNILVPGQAESEIQGLQDAYVHPRLDYIYNATLMEYLVALFCIALGMAVFAFGIWATEKVAARSDRKGVSA